MKNNYNIAEMQAIINKVAENRLWCFITQHERMPFRNATIINWVKDDLAKVGYYWKSFDKELKEEIKRYTMECACKVYVDAMRYHR